MKTIRFTVIILLFIINHGFAQEFTYPLNSNPALDVKNLKNSLRRMSVIDDTITLPFVDDFSRPGMYPFDSLWLDSGVYINNNYSARPFTIGMATFDGLNQYGRPYNPSATSDAPADYLTSRQINLAVSPGDTTVWLSFFYQPQGLGDIPEPADSLILQLKDTSEAWTTVWSVPGHADTLYQRVNINIREDKYFFKGFQFRFYNIATINGNRDQWNLDYVSLKQGTIINDSISDNSLLRPQMSLLNEYSSMPYSHYKTLGASAMRATIEDTIFDINYAGGAGTTFGAAAEILYNGTSIFSGTQTVFNTSSNSYTPFAIPLNGFYYPDNLAVDSADFLVKSYFNQSGVSPTNKYNDTSYYHQQFYNCYSYDDGSVEISYGLTGNSDVEWAYQFDIKITDTLRGVQIYFNPTGVNVTNKLFQLAAWSNVAVGHNPATLIYKMINQKPDSFDGINAFKTYLFDTTIVVGPGPIWVGLIQNEPGTLYGVGLDRNTDSRNKMYYHLDGEWFTSTIPFPGSWMIRPIFGKDISLVSVANNENRPPKFSVYPNPASNRLYLNVDVRKNYTVEVFNGLGSLVHEEKITDSKTIDVAAFSKGIYMIRLVDIAANSSSIQKLILQ